MKELLKRLRDLTKPRRPPGGARARPQARLDVTVIRASGSIEHYTVSDGKQRRTG